MPESRELAKMKPDTSADTTCGMLYAALSHLPPAQCRQFYTAARLICVYWMSYRASHLEYSV
jgi:hypothetical protein